MEKIISQEGWDRLENDIKTAEGNYLESVQMVALYGADQDGWHGEAYAMHYAEQLKKQDELMSLKKIQKDFQVQHKKPNGRICDIGVEVAVEINNKIQNFIIDGYRYKNKVPVVTPESPLGKAILRRKPGEEFGYVINDRFYQGKIVSIEVPI